MRINYTGEISSKCDVKKDERLSNIKYSYSFRLLKTFDQFSRHHHTISIKYHAKKGERISNIKNDYCLKLL